MLRLLCNFSGIDYYVLSLCSNATKKSFIVQSIIIFLACTLSVISAVADCHYLKAGYAISILVCSFWAFVTWNFYRYCFSSIHWMPKEFKSEEVLQPPAHVATIIKCLFVSLILFVTYQSIIVRIYDDGLLVNLKQGKSLLFGIKSVYHEHPEAYGIIALLVIIFSLPVYLRSLSRKFGNEEYERLHSHLWLSCIHHHYYLFKNETYPQTWAACQNAQKQYVEYYKDPPFNTQPKVKVFSAREKGSLFERLNG